MPTVPLTTVLVISRYGTDLRQHIERAARSGAQCGRDEERDEAEVAVLLNEAGN